MTDADLDAMEAALARRLGPWLRRAGLTIDGAMGDAAAHAEKALTGRLVRSPDGRASMRRIEASPSYRAALGRLDRLRDAMIGPTRDSLSGLIRDARAAFYADSVALWKPHIEPGYRAVPDPVPTGDGERLMRGAIVHGLDLYREVEPAFDAARRDLIAALNNAGRRATPDSLRSQRLATWHGRASDRLKSKVFQVLSDSDKAVHEATGLLLLAPRYRDELTSAAGDGGLHMSMD